MNLSIKKYDKIYVAGHKGLVGSAILKKMKEMGFLNIITRTHAELDLINQNQVNVFFEQESPDYVILAAAKVGGIFANNTYPADFIYQNLMIEANVVNASHKNKVKRLLFLGSTCIYPREAMQPMREDELLTNILEPTNEPYALAKIAGIKLCESYNRQYDSDFRSIMPSSLYGKNDNFDLKKSHVIPAVMRKVYLAKCLEENDWDSIRADITKNPIDGINIQSPKKEILKLFREIGIKQSNIQGLKSEISVDIWGSGNAFREFLHVDDMAEAAIFVLRLDKDTYQTHTKPMSSHINVGTGNDITIRDLVGKIKDIVGFKGQLIFNSAKPDGSFRKLIDPNRLSKMGWSYSIDLDDGLKDTFDWYLKES